MVVPERDPKSKPKAKKQDKYAVPYSDTAECLEILKKRLDLSNQDAIVGVFKKTVHKGRLSALLGRGREVNLWVHAVRDRLRISNEQLDVILLITADSNDLSKSTYSKTVVIDAIHGLPIQFYIDKANERTYKYGKSPTGNIKTAVEFAAAERERMEFMECFSKSISRLG